MKTMWNLILSCSLAYWLGEPTIWWVGSKFFHLLGLLRRGYKTPREWCRLSPKVIHILLHGPQSPMCKSLGSLFISNMPQSTHHLFQPLPLSTHTCPKMKTSPLFHLPSSLVVFLITEKLLDNSLIAWERQVTIRKEVWILIQHLQAELLNWVRQMGIKENIFL